MAPSRIWNPVWCRLTPELTCARVQQNASEASFPKSLGILRHFNTVLLATFDERDYIITG